jgi:hypothetical protein
MPSFLRHTFRSSPGMCDRWLNGSPPPLAQTSVFDEFRRDRSHKAPDLSHKAGHDQGGCRRLGGMGGGSHTGHSGPDPDGRWQAGTASPARSPRVLGWRRLRSLQDRAPPRCARRLPRVAGRARFTCAFSGLNTARKQGAPSEKPACWLASDGAPCRTRTCYLLIRKWSFIPWLSTTGLWGGFSILGGLGILGSGAGLCGRNVETDRCSLSP